jgi:hypothetical protein
MELIWLQSSVRGRELVVYERLNIDHIMTLVASVIRTCALATSPPEFWEADHTGSYTPMSVRLYFLNPFACYN